MPLPDLFAGEHPPRISYEVFPPRTEKAEKSLPRVVERLIALEPAYMTVTYGALGSTRDQTLGIAAGIRRDHEIETACHLTCVGSTREEIDAILDNIAAADIHNIVALRGDPPQGEKAFKPPEGGFAHASELVSHIKARGQFGIAVAGYPEKHLEAPDMKSDIGFLRHKVECGGDVVITQLFYDNADFFRFVDDARAAGVKAPIVPGLLPILSAKQIRKISGLCGSKIPAELEQRLSAAGDDAEGVMEVGIDWAVEQADELLARGVPGIHFYVLNRAKHMERIIGALRERGRLA